MPGTFADPSEPAVPLFVVAVPELEQFLGTRPEAEQAWIRAQSFGAEEGQIVVLPDAKGAVAGAVAGIGSEKSRARGRFQLAAAISKLPEAAFELVHYLDGDALEEAALGWLLQSYQFSRYREQKPLKARLKVPEGIDAAKIEAIALGEILTRDLINTPASDMGPEALARAAADLAQEHGAEFNEISGDALIKQNFPMIHAVGRAADQAPRLLELNWGRTGPRLTLVGKGVCFDTGGLNIKPAASIGLMKKDMGGAATVLGLARMIMALGLPLRLRVLIPAVENSIGGNAFRPQDILTSRKGLTVEINNTDAEGRLVLADALALASEEPPDLLISMATLTGAARVALGPDLTPYFTDDDEVAGVLASAGNRVGDPVWRLPFWTPYESMIEPGIADLDNAPKGGFGGAITAALFLRRFVSEAERYVHFDIYGWQPTAAPARPKGGVGQGARAILDALPKLLEL